MSDEFTIGPKLPGSENRAAIKHTEDGNSTPCVVGVVRDGQDLRQYEEAYQLHKKDGRGSRYSSTKVWERPTTGPAQVATEEYRDNYERTFN